MNINSFMFGANNLKKGEIQGKRILEVGSLDINGSLQTLFKSYQPREYVGVDMVLGRGVDVVCKADDLIREFGEQSFDVVVSTETIEHIRDWKEAIHNIKGVCKNGGIILITARSRGFVYHAYPYDFWRFEAGDMRVIFQDCKIEKIESDPQNGAFIKVLKPENFVERDISGYRLYSIILNRSIIDPPGKEVSAKRLKWIIFKMKLRDFLHSVIDCILFKFIF